MKDNSREGQLNIAYVCREFGPVTGGGIGTYIYNACLAMSNRGHRVFLITDCFNDSNLDLLPIGVELVRLHAVRENRVGSFVSPHHEYSYRVYDTLLALVAEKKIDVAEFAEFGVEGFATIRAKRLFGQFADTKLIVKLHTPSSLLYTINEDRRLHVDSFCDYTMEDYCVRYADMVTSPSLSLGQYFEQRVGRKGIAKCPYPVDLPVSGGARTFTDHQVRRVRLIGSVQVRKGIDTFIRAAVKILRNDPDFLFEIWGADRNALLFGKTYIDIVEKLIPSEFKDRIIFAGGIPYSEIPALFQDSCFCVYPSRWENWANVCLEAMSYGCVVLASKEGGMSEMVEHGKSGFVVDPLNPDDIADTILAFYKNKKKLEEVSHCAQKRSQEICDPENTSLQIEQNYQQAIKKKKWQITVENVPSVSVVIPFYNQPQYLRETIASVKKSTYPHLEIVVVNDGSTTKDANSLFESLTGVTKVQKENGGLSSARNAGVAAASGDYVLPLDADDLIEPSYIQKGVEALLNNPELGYVSCHAQNFGELRNAYIPIGFVPELMPYMNSHGKCTNLYRKELFAQYGGYDEVMTSYEDWDFLLTLDENGVEGDVLPDEMFHYRRHFDSMVYVTANRQRADLIQYMMIKHEKALAPHAPQMAIMLARLWKETEMKCEFAGQQLVNAHFNPTSVDQLQTGYETRLQVYSQVNGQWWEHNSVYVDYTCEKWHVLRLNLPFEGHDGILRIDPSNAPGTIFVKDFALRERSYGRKLFYSSAGNNFQNCSFSEQVTSASREGGLIITSPDDDPQILLPQLSGTGGLIFEITLYFTNDEQCDRDHILKSYKKSTFKNLAKSIVRRIVGAI